MSETKIPELWRICATTSIKYFLDKNNKQFKTEDTGTGENSGDEVCDYLATKDGWMKFSLDKRLEAKIITDKEYNYAFECYENIRKKLSDKQWIKKESKDIYLRKSNFEIPTLNNKVDKKKLTLFQKKVNDCILDLQKTKKGLITYKTLTEYYKRKYNTNIKESTIASKGVKNLYKFYYNREDLPVNF